MFALTHQTTSFHLILSILTISDWKEALSFQKLDAAKYHISTVYANIAMPQYFPFLHIVKCEIEPGVYPLE